MKRFMHYLSEDEKNILKEFLINNKIDDNITSEEYDIIIRTLNYNIIKLCYYRDKLKYSFIQLLKDCFNKLIK